MAIIRFKAKIDTNSRLVRPRPIGGPFEVFQSEDGFCAFIHCDVIALISRHEREGRPNEVIGLLAGRICQDPKTGPYTIVMIADAARKGEYRSTPGDVELLAMGHESVRCRLEDANPDREVIGWYHTHPNCDPIFSRVDLKEQKSWNDPNHIGIVYSGTSRDKQLGVYRGPDAIPLKPIPPREPVAQSVRTENQIVGRPNYHSQTAVDLHVAKPQLSHGKAQRLPVSALPGSSGSRRLLITILIIIAGICVVQAASLFWLNRRVSKVEDRLQQVAAFRSAERVTENEPPRSSSIPKPKPDALQSTQKANRVDDAELNTPAKPFSPANKPGQPSRTQKANASRAEKRKRDVDKQSGTRERNVSSQAQAPSKPGEQIVPKSPPSSSPKSTVKPD